MDSLTTTDGKVYKSVVVMSSDAAGIDISYDRGEEIIPFEKLPVEIQRKYGYDPEKAKAFLAAKAENGDVTPSVSTSGDLTKSPPSTSQPTQPIIGLSQQKIFENTKFKAERGDARSQCQLGAYYQDGRGVAKDQIEAVKWFRKATDQNDAWAQLYLGWCYESGRGIRKDEVEAVRWFRKAAEQNYPSAQCYLGGCYQVGKGVPADCVEADKWFHIYADQTGYIEKRITPLEKQMTPEQIAKSKQLAHDFIQSAPSWLLW